MTDENDAPIPTEDPIATDPSILDERIVWKGWIRCQRWTPPQKEQVGLQWDTDTLEEIGVKLGTFNPTEWEYTYCEVSADAMVKLDGYWGTFVWGLESDLANE